MVLPKGVLFQTYRLEFTGDVFGFAFKICIRVTTVDNIKTSVFLSESAPIHFLDSKQGHKSHLLRLFQPPLVTFAWNVCKIFKRS